MILDYFEGKNFTPQSWEELCDSCYSLRYPGRWHKVPAAYLGDCGIEGFIDDGIVYQCYYPEQEYSNDELYAHQRDKLSTDILKIILLGVVILMLIDFLYRLHYFQMKYFS